MPVTLYIFTVRVEVTITRENGQRHVPIAASRKLKGRPHARSHPRAPRDRTVAVLRVLGDATGRMLFDPKVSRLGAGTIVFTGLERVEHAWCAQEWACDVG